MYPYYICTVLFLMPYLASVFYYTLEVSFYIDKIDMGGNITEPDPPDWVMDLSDVSLLQSCVFVCAMPCIMCIQCSDLVVAIHKAYAKHYRDRPFFEFGKRDAQYAEPQHVKRKRRVLRRIWKTLTRWFRGAK
jgi:hypothetical protein